MRLRPRPSSSDGHCQIFSHAFNCALEQALQHQPCEGSACSSELPSWGLAWVPVSVTDSAWSPLPRTPRSCMIVALYNASCDSSDVHVDIELPGQLVHRVAIRAKTATRILSETAPVLVCQSATSPRIRMSSACAQPCILMALYVEINDTNERVFWGRDNHCFVFQDRYLLYRAGATELLRDIRQVTDHYESTDQYITRTYMHYLNTVNQTEFINP